MDTIYVADSYSKAGTGNTTNGAVEKYTCTPTVNRKCLSGASAWTFRGYVVAAYPTGLTAKVTSSGVDIFVTAGNKVTAAVSVAPTAR